MSFWRSSSGSNLINWKKAGCYLLSSFILSFIATKYIAISLEESGVRSLYKSSADQVLSVIIVHFKK